MSEAKLPAGFEDLSPWLDWALPTADQRQTRRRLSSKAELKAFYEAVLPRVEAMLAEADRFPLGKLPADQQLIYNIALSLAEVAPHIELYGGAPGVPYAFEEARFVAVHGAHETWQAKNPMVA